jgi:hypothetical protein
LQDMLRLLKLWTWAREERKSKRSLVLGEDSAGALQTPGIMIFGHTNQLSSNFLSFLCYIYIYITICHKIASQPQI